jgi:hypothetical protein
MGTIRRCERADFAAILAIVNDAAQAYRGHIPADRWHDPYMPADELERELEAGVVFWGWEESGSLVGVMGLQDVRDVTLIRHAYVARRAMAVSAAAPRAPPDGRRSRCHTGRPPHGRSALRAARLRLARG